MRTTLTLADDVVVLLRKEAGRSGRMFRDVVNDALRAGLSRSNSARPERPPPDPTRVWHAEEVLVPNVDNIEEVLTDLEGPWRR